jgi:hypothetical protein
LEFKKEMMEASSYEYIIKARRICMKLSENKFELYNDRKRYWKEEDE